VKLPVRDSYGKEVRTLEVDETVFGIMPNGAVLHQAYVAQRANQRAGTASTKTRGEVQGSTRKIRRQKYTGRSRQGGIRAPHHKGGGVVFGPKPRDYSQSLNKKMRRLAIRSALSGKVADGQLVIIDQLAFETPRTKQMLEALRNNGIERSALIVTAASDLGVRASARNLPKTTVLPAAYLNVVDMMHHHSVLITEEAVRITEGLWGKHAVALAVAEKAKRARAVKAEAIVEAPPAPTPKAAPARAKRAAKAAVEPEAPVVVAKPAPARAKRAAKAAVESEAPAPAAKPAPARAKRAAKAAVEVEAPAAVAEASPEEIVAEAPKRPRAPAKPKAEATPKATVAPAKKPARAPAKRAPAKAKASPAADEAAPEAKPRRRTRKTDETED
jgi:large subunit ribosomal protein L4